MNTTLHAQSLSLTHSHHASGRLDLAAKSHARESLSAAVVWRDLSSNGSTVLPLLQQQPCRGRGTAIQALRLQTSSTIPCQPADVPLRQVSSILSALGVSSIAEEDVGDAEQLAATQADVAKVLETLSSRQSADWQEPGSLADLIIACEALGVAWDHLLDEPDTTLGADELLRLSSRQLTQLALACCERCGSSKFTTTLMKCLASRQSPCLSPSESLAILEALLHHRELLPASLSSQLVRKSASTFTDKVKDLAANEVAIILAALGVCHVKKVENQLLWELAACFSSTLSGADGRSISRALVGFAKIGWQPPMLVQQVVSYLNRHPAQLQQFSSADLVHLLWALAQLNASGASTLNLIKTSSIILLISHTATAGPLASQNQAASTSIAAQEAAAAAPPVQAVAPTSRSNTFGALQTAALQLASNFMTAASALTKPATAGPAQASQSASRVAAVDDTLGDSTSVATTSGSRSGVAAPVVASPSLSLAGDVANPGPAVKAAKRRRLTARELSVIAWACVRCGDTNKTLLSQVLRLLMAASPSRIGVEANVDPAVVAQAVWACGRLKYWQPGLEAWVEACVLGRVMDGTVGSQNVAVVAWSMAVCGKRPSTQFVQALLEYSCEHMQSFRARELSALLWALASWGGELPTSFQAAVFELLARRHNSFSAWELCSIVMSLDRLVQSIPHTLLSSFEQQLVAATRPLLYRPLSWFLLCCQRKGFRPQQLCARMCSSASDFLALVCIAELDELNPRLDQQARQLGLKRPLDVRGWPSQVAALVFGLGCHAGWMIKERDTSEKQLKQVVAMAEQELLRRPTMLAPETLASVLWAMSEARHVPSSWLKQGLHRTLHRAVPAMTFKDLSLTLLALSKWHQQRHLGQAQAAYVQTPAINRLHMLLARSRLASTSSSPSSDYAPATRGQSLLPAFAGAQQLAREEVKPHMLVDVAAALSHLPCYSSRLLNTIANMTLSSLSSFNGRTITALLSALATLRHDEPRLLKTVAQVYPAYPKWRPPTLAAVQRLLSSYAKLNQQPGEYVMQAALDTVRDLGVCEQLRKLADSSSSSSTYVSRRVSNGATRQAEEGLSVQVPEMSDVFDSDEWEVVLPSTSFRETEQNLFSSPDEIVSTGPMAVETTSNNLDDRFVSITFDSEQDEERVIRSLESNTSTSSLIASITVSTQGRRQGSSSRTAVPASLTCQSNGAADMANSVGLFASNGSAARGDQLLPATLKDVELVCTIMYYLGVMKQHTSELSNVLGSALVVVLEANGQALDVCGHWIGACLALAEADGSESPFMGLSADNQSKCRMMWQQQTKKKSRPKQAYPVLRDICKVLQALGLETHAGCLTSDGTTFIDVSFSFTGRQMALELLVPGKNCTRNTLKLSGEGSLRRRLLQARGYHVIYLSCKTWAGMGSNWDAKLRFVRKLLAEVPGRKHLGDFDEVHIQERVRAGNGNEVAVVNNSEEEAGAIAGSTAAAGRRAPVQQQEEEQAPTLQQPPSIGESRIPVLRSLASRQRAFYQQQLQGSRLSLAQASAGSPDATMVPEAGQMRSALSAGV